MCRRRPPAAMWTSPTRRTPDRCFLKCTYVLQRFCCLCIASSRKLLIIIFNELVWKPPRGRRLREGPRDVVVTISAT